MVRCFFSLMGDPYFPGIEYAGVAGHDWKFHDVDEVLSTKIRKWSQLSLLCAKSYMWSPWPHKNKVLQTAFFFYIAYRLLVHSALVYSYGHFSKPLYGKKKSSSILSLGANSCLLFNSFCRMLKPAFVLRLSISCASVSWSAAEDSSQSVGDERRQAFGVPAVDNHSTKDKP